MSSHLNSRRKKAKITKCINGKYKIGSGSCIHPTRSAAAKARDRK